MYYYLAIALTGSIVLGVEVLSSRILTPYFGVSLYIWASILIITLICLAGGYFCGGILTRKKSVEQIRAAFSLFLNTASLALSLSAALYPFIFPALMKLHLVAGSLLAGIVLMAIPLLLFSALNSFVIVLARTEKGAVGDAGAGTVFFISTLGSVAGVVVTAFLVIPLLSNTVGLLVFSLATALLSFAGAWLYLQNPQERWRACSFAAVAAACSIGLLVMETNFQKVKFVDKEGVAWNVLDERHSIFGSIKVVDKISNGASVRFYLTDGLFQDAMLQDGQSAAMFSYVITSLLKQYAPDAQNILFLGLAAGIVPKDFPAPRYKTEIVEINPDSLDVARQYFGFDDKNRVVHIQDARTFVNGCRGRFDAVVFDMFHGDGVPDYLLSKEFFQQVKLCGSKDGIIVMNIFDDQNEPEVRNAILATVNSAFSNVGYFEDVASERSVRNAFIVASNRNLTATVTAGQAPAFLVPSISAALSSGRIINPSFYGNASPLRDDHNIYSVLSIGLNMHFRKIMQGSVPEGLYKS
jgi:predicted membrane-bound spermidine synthase